jgi:hypothetical protein
MRMTPSLPTLRGLTSLGSHAGAPCHDEGDSHEQMNHRRSRLRRGKGRSVFARELPTYEPSVFGLTTVWWATWEGENPSAGASSCAEPNATRITPRRLCSNRCRVRTVPRFGRRTPPFNCERSAATGQGACCRAECNGELAGAIAATLLDDVEHSILVSTHRVLAVMGVDDAH